MKSLLKGPVIINAVLFQITWFACVLSGANELNWPAFAACAILAIWQLHPKRRHANDLRLIIVAVLLGLIVDSLWINAGLMDFKAQWPLAQIAPAWMVTLWIGFALTINHSLSWLTMHPALPAAMGLIGGPLSYLAGLRLEAVDYLGSTWVTSVWVGLAWALSMIVLVKVSQVGVTDKDGESESTSTV